VNKQQMRSLTAYRNVVSFLETGPIPKDLELPQLRARLRDTVKEIEKLSGIQLQVGGRLMGAARRQLENVRALHMLKLARVARRHFAGEPTVLAALRVPHKKATSEEILRASVLMTQTLQPHRRFLTASGVDALRIGRLREETRQVQKLFDAAAVRTPLRTLATHELKPLFISARNDLDAIDLMMKDFCSGPELVAWRVASRVGKRLGRPRKPRRRPSNSE